MIWYDIIRYDCYPFIPASLSIIYLLWNLCIINIQSRMSTCYNFSAYIIVLPCTAAVILILRVKNTSKPSRSVYEEK